MTMASKTQKRADIGQFNEENRGMGGMCLVSVVRLVPGYSVDQQRDAPEKNRKKVRFHEASID